MTVQEFFDKYNLRGINFDGYYGNQCMDAYQQYNKEVIGAPSVPANPAYKVWYYNLYPLAFYTKILNTPDAIPQKGDIIIWNPNLNGGSGHIAICYSADLYKFISFDQNFPSQGYYDSYGNFIGTGVCHFETHNYNYVYGWLRPKTQALTDDQFVNANKVILDSNDTPQNKRARVKVIV